MRDWWQRKLLEWWFRLGVRLGFHSIAVFAPGLGGDNNSQVRAITFAINDWWMNQLLATRKEVGNEDQAESA